LYCEEDEMGASIYRMQRGNKKVEYNFGSDISFEGLVVDEHVTLVLTRGKREKYLSQTVKGSTLILLLGPCKIWT
jgi:hypothetical protein